MGDPDLGTHNDCGEFEADSRFVFVHLMCCIHTYIRTRSLIRSSLLTHSHAHVHTRIHRYIRTGNLRAVSLVHTSLHTQTHSGIYTACMLTYLHTSHAQTHAGIVRARCQTHTFFIHTCMLTYLHTSHTNTTGIARARCQTHTFSPPVYTRRPPKTKTSPQTRPLHRQMAMLETTSPQDFGGKLLAGSCTNRLKGSRACGRRRFWVWLIWLGLG